MIAKRMLERMGYTVKAFDNALDAVDDFSQRADSYDIVITDQTMPNLTGEEVCKQISSIRPDIPMVLCTGLLYSPDLDNVTVSAGSAFRLQKPFRFVELAKAVRSAVEGSYAK